MRKHKLNNKITVPTNPSEESFDFGKLRTLPNNNAALKIKIEDLINR